MPNLNKKMVIEVSQTGAEKTAASLGMLDKAQARVAGSGNQANMVLLNTTRVVQDMPYGLIAVSNNVDMLVQQFISLRATSGGTIGALTAIKTALMGPSGLLFLFSAGTAALTMWALASRDSGNAARDLAKELENLKEADLRLARARFGAGSGSFEEYRASLEKRIGNLRQTEASLREELNAERRKKPQITQPGDIDIDPGATGTLGLAKRSTVKAKKEGESLTEKELDLTKKLNEAVEQRIQLESELGSVQEKRSRLYSDRLNDPVGDFEKGMDARGKGQELAIQARRENEERRRMRNLDRMYAQDDAAEKRQRALDEAQRSLHSGFGQLNSSLQTLGVTSDSVFGRMIDSLNKIYALIQLINSVKTIASAVSTLFGNPAGVAGAAGSAGNLEAVLAAPENRRALAMTVRDMSRKGML